MKREHIIQMAREFSYEVEQGETFSATKGEFIFNEIGIENLVAAIRAATKEEDAKICEEAIDPEWPNDDMSVQAQDLASAIRASK